MARETQSQLESRGESQKMDKIVTSDYYYKRLRPFNSSNMNSVSSSYSKKSSSNGSSAANTIISQSYATTVTSDNQNTFTSRMIRAAILSACPNIDLRSFKELSAESTIMAGLEKDLLKYDEIHVSKLNPNNEKNRRTKKLILYHVHFSLCQLIDSKAL